MDGRGRLRGSCWGHGRARAPDRRCPEAPRGPPGPCLRWLRPAFGGSAASWGLSSRRGVPGEGSACEASGRGPGRDRRAGRGARAAPCSRGALVTWPGTTAPPVHGAGRRRRTPTKRRGPSSTAARMLAIARRVGVAPKAEKKTEDIGRCLQCVCADLGFSSPTALGAYLDALSLRGRGKPLARVRLPPEKRPRHVKLVVGIHCQKCGGRGCETCGFAGWAILFRIAKHVCVKPSASSNAPAVPLPQSR
jgi:hypothetical protein